MFLFSIALACTGPFAFHKPLDINAELKGLSWDNTSQPKELLVIERGMKRISHYTLPEIRNAITIYLQYERGFLSGSLEPITDAGVAGGRDYTVGALNRLLFFDYVNELKPDKFWLTTKTQAWEKTRRSMHLLADPLAGFHNRRLDVDRSKMYYDPLKEFDDLAAISAKRSNSKP